MFTDPYIFCNSGVARNHALRIRLAQAARLRWNPDVMVLIAAKEMRGSAMRSLNSGKGKITKW